MHAVIVRTIVVVVVVALIIGGLFYLASKMPR